MPHTQTPPRSFFVTTGTALLAVLASACATPLPAPQSIAIAIAIAVPIPNAGFEQGSPSNAKLPSDWRLDGEALETVLDKNKKHQGAQALRVKFKEGAPYAGVLQRLNTDAMRGKTVLATAWFAREQDEATVGIWMLASDKDGKRIAYANSYETDAAKKKEWTQHQVRLLIPAEATSALLGVAIYDKDGTMWVDQVELEVQP